MSFNNAVSTDKCSLYIEFYEHEVKHMILGLDEFTVRMQS